MKPKLIVLTVAALLAGCSSNYEEADAYGTFEAIEVIVSSESNGRIIDFPAKEGSDIRKGGEVALIDTTLLHLQKGEIDAGMLAVRSRLASINAQNGIIEQQINNLEIDLARVGNMLENEAATRKQLDDLTGQLAVFRKQIEANNTQRSSVNAELSLYGSKKALLNEQIDRSFVVSPLDGTILEKYSEAGEITASGRPLVKIADLSVMRLRVYVSGSQLGTVKIGNNCRVRIDEGEKEYKSYEGTISYISGKAEFTPKIIQTKEERVTLVYAVIIDIVNDGTMKAGMPGEAIF